jgi:predicted porin
MKKSLLALAVLGAFAGAASAQSSVTVYGQVDLGVSKGNGGTAPNQGANGLSEAWRVQQSHGSRLGFRGNEDLGGGLSAQFLIEHRFQPDSGVATNSTNSTTASANFWDGGSYVQLTSAAAGSVYLGRWYTPTFWINLKTDPFGYDGVAQVGSKGLAGFLTPSPSGPGVRTANTVGYKTPNWGGFTANVAIGAGESVHGRDTAANVEYTAGPIYAGAAYEKVTGSGTSSATAGAVDGNSVVNAGFAYNFGFIRPMVYFARSKTGVGSVNTNKLASFALTAPVGPGVIKAVFLKFNPQDDKDETKIGVGYDHFLSKRTRLYADYGTTKKDGVNTAATPAGTGYTNNHAFNIGVRHDF